MLRDTMGCGYEIQPFSGLDPASQREAHKVLWRRGVGLSAAVEEAIGDKR